MCMKEEYRKKETYCRKLGHAVKFSYCCSERKEIPCSKIRDCWFEIIPIDMYLREHFSQDELGRIFQPSKNKIASLIELIEKAKSSAD